MPARFLNKRYLLADPVPTPSDVYGWSWLAAPSPPGLPIMPSLSSSWLEFIGCSCIQALPPILQSQFWGFIDQCPTQTAAVPDPFYFEIDVIQIEEGCG